MDLRLGAMVPATEEERAAIASVLGPADTGWDGGQRTVADGHVAYGGRAARARRHLLITVLHSVQERIGWISPGAIDHIAERLAVPPAEAYGVASFYALFRTAPSPGAVVHVCDDLACQVNGAEELRADEAPVRQRGQRVRLRRRGGHLAAQPVPRPVRPRLGRAHPARGRRPGPRRARPGGPGPDLAFADRP
jgi:NADH-quinone oxidoreductase subunit F